MKILPKLLLATASLVMAGSAFAEDVKIGILLGFTGPLESITPAMAKSAEMAIKKVNDSRQLLGGSSVTAVRGDSTCQARNVELSLAVGGPGYAPGSAVLFGAAS